MTISIVEKGLRFDFGGGWTQALKWDEHGGWHRQNISRQLRDSKAVDLVAVWQRMLYFIEIKDGRKEEVGLRQRLSSEALFLEVGLKVRDSLASLVGAMSKGNDEQKWAPFRQAFESQPKIRVVLWMEMRTGPTGHGLQEIRALKAEAETSQAQLLKRVGWLTDRAIVTSSRLGPHRELPGLTVTSLPGAV